MSAVFAIAGRELTRLRIRFAGRVRLLMLILLVGSGLLSLVAYQRQTIRGQNLYAIGVSPGGPSITDPRFRVLTLSEQEGSRYLDQNLIDCYVDEQSVIKGNTDKASYAANALRLYLEELELTRISRDYDTAAAFPLRVNVRSFPIDETTQTTPEQTVGPSLMETEMPFAGVVTTTLYLFPIFLVSMFFTGGFMEEKVDRRISVLLSAPVSPLQIILGKMLPYFAFAVFSVVGIALILADPIFLTLLSLVPVILFVLSVYLMVPLLYRTFKDTTFISMLATTIITVYLVFPAMFSGVSDLSYTSPLTLILDAEVGQSLTLRHYLTSMVPMTLVSAVLIYVGSRSLNEDFLNGFRPIFQKLSDAIYLSMHRGYPGLSILLASAFLIPIVYMAQLGALTFSANLSARPAIAAVLISSLIIEEIAKSLSIKGLIEHHHVEAWYQVVLYAFLSALGFLVGEKLLVVASISVVSQSALSAVLVNAGKLWIPLLAHFVFTSLVSLGLFWFGARRYVYSLSAGVFVHLVYNLAVLGLIE
jgi:ABC-type Na+ efflux pump permease subunit